MASRYVVALHIEPPFSRKVTRRPLTSLARRVLQAEGAEPARELSIVITDDEAVRDLNRRFRDEDAPTDVLSFSMDDEAEFVIASGERVPLGEVIISFPTAERQADSAGHSVLQELEHLLAHGILHLLGYDHQRPAERRRMRAREEELLGRPTH